MANGYGSSSSPSSSNRQSGQTSRRQAAPPGFHYMPDGTLMSDAEHEALYGNEGQETPSLQQQVAPPGFHYMPDGTLMSDAEHNRLYNTPTPGVESNIIPTQGTQYKRIASIDNCGAGNDTLPNFAASPQQLEFPVWRICKVNIVPGNTINGGLQPTPTMQQSNQVAITYDPLNPWMIRTFSTNNNNSFVPSFFLDFLNEAIAAAAQANPGDTINVGDRVEINLNYPQPGTTAQGNNIDAGICASTISNGVLSGYVNFFCLEYLGMTLQPTGLSAGIPTGVNQTPYGNYNWWGFAAMLEASVYTFLKYDCCNTGCGNVITTSGSSRAYHSWEICAISTSTTAFTNSVNFSGGFAFNGCPLNPGPFGMQPNGSSLPLTPAHMDAFYDWVVQQVGLVNIGDSIEFDMTNTAPAGTPGNAPLNGEDGTGMCNLGPYQDVNKICFVYQGQIATSGMGWNGPYASLNRDCCEGFDPYRPSRYDCVKKKVMGQGSGGTPYIHHCVERPYPQPGQYPTLAACESNCGKGVVDTPLFPGGPKKIKLSGNKEVDGWVLMPSDVYVTQEEFEQTYGDGSEKIITELKLDLNDLTVATETRSLEIKGSDGAEFILEIKNAAGNYYNFYTKTFASAHSFLDEKIDYLLSSSYKNEIVFPASGTDDQYDVLLHAKAGTRHVNYKEKLFEDGSIDLNGSIGSNSLLLQKVIYQYTTLTLTLSGFSIGSTIAGTAGTDTISISRGKTQEATPFSFTYTAGTTAAYRVLRQPTSDDVLSFVQPTVGANPIDLPGENIYPTRRDAFTGDDINGAVTSGTTVDTDAADISTNIAVGDKITTDVMTDTVNGLVNNTDSVTMDSAVATKMAVGDRVTGNDQLNSGNFTVKSIDSTNVFSLTAAATIADGTTLSFSSLINSSTTTVVSFPGDESAFVISQAVQFRDNAPLHFFPRKNYSWSIDNHAHLIKEGMIVLQDTNVVENTKIAKYQNTTTTSSGTKNEYTQSSKTISAVRTEGIKPTVVKGLITTQAGDITFNNQQVLALGGDVIKVGAYGESEVYRLFGWEVEFTDLAIALTAPTTTTTAASVGSATITVADREGVINNISRIGGIGIDSSIQNPLITAGGGADGAGTLTADAIQNIENGATLTIENTSRVATITGNIRIKRAGTANQTLRFDVNRLLSTSA
tara:strand:- start:836 stop:4336 length:3501 start_codon:yes stop_codon:yes gene_type:complete